MQNKAREGSDALWGSERGKKVKKGVGGRTVNFMLEKLFLEKLSRKFQEGKAMLGIVFGKFHFWEVFWEVFSGSLILETLPSEERLFNRKHRSETARMAVVQIGTREMKLKPERTARS